MPSGVAPFDRINPIRGRLLAIYLQDHLAGAVAGTELVARVRSSNEGTALGDFAARLEDEIAADRGALEQIMESLEITGDRVKVSLAWTLEKVGRLKLNGRLRGYSPLSRLTELEGLHVAISAKLATWQSLRATFGEEAAGRNLGGLIRRAEDQLDELEAHRAEAARVAFGDEPARIT